MIKKLNSCRLSGSENLIPVISLGNQCLTGVFPKKRNQIVTKGPLELVWSPESKLLQLNHTFSLKEMYGKNYGYRSGLNQSMVNHLEGKIHGLEKKYFLRSDDAVLDIGSNDGTTLKAYKTKGITRFGVDPTAGKFKMFYPRSIKLINDFFPSTKLFKSLGKHKFKIITSIAMFYDLEKPVEFAKSIKKCLNKNGVWHFEQSYMPSMLRCNSYDTICHEHLEYYTLENIKYICDAAGLKILDVQMNLINGGSFAVTATHSESKKQPNQKMIDWLLEQEIKLGLDSPRPFREFEQRVFSHRDSLKSLIQKIKDSKKKILGYGASTKGNVLLQFCGISSQHLDAIIDVNPDKNGAFTPGTNIPIVDEERGRRMQADYFLVLPWHFRNGILAREKNFLERGGKIIFPLPEIEIIGEN